MASNVIQFPRGKGLDDESELDPNEMLGLLKDEVSMTEAIVVGWTDEGNLFLLELAKSVLMNRCVSDEDE